MSFYNDRNLFRPMYDYPTVAYLKIIANVREVVHDGYCSDPGEDIGEWENNKTIKLPLNEIMFIYFKHHLDAENNVDPEIIQKTLTGSLGCNMGSNYCGYNSEIKVIKGTIEELKLGYKPLENGCIATLEITGEKDEEINNNEGRTSEVKILNIIDYKTGKQVPSAPGLLKKSYIYKPGNTIKARFEDEDINTGYTYYKKFEDVKKFLELGFN